MRKPVSCMTAFDRAFAAAWFKSPAPNFEDAKTLAKTMVQGTEWEVLIAEHQDEAFPGQVEPGDLLIRLERAQ